MNILFTVFGTYTYYKKREKIQKSKISFILQNPKYIINIFLQLLFLKQCYYYFIINII